MAPEPQSDYQRAARLKWPEYVISGDGPFAIVCPVSYSVFLYTFAMAAMADIARDHSNWDCKDEHRLVELKAVPQRAPLTIRNRAALERD
jgi:hypothetical protein